MPDTHPYLDTVMRRIRAAELRCHRPPGGVTLVAVSKGHTPEAIRSVAGAGQRRFGESYVQEALPKMAALRDLDLEWHFIGRLQSNKAKAISGHFAWVHSVDSLKAAQALSAHRPPDLPPLNMCIQLNVSGERHKAGINMDEIAALATSVMPLPHLVLRGLMALPAPSTDFAEQLRTFKLVYDAFQALQSHGMSLDTLSMGMSHDLEAAIAAGATMVRVGAAVFGQRPEKTTK
jgi:pyridoxal phosphate enzyme (YggS family)